MRVNAFFDVQRKWWPHWTITAAMSPEAVGVVDWPPRLYQGSVTYAATNRLLFEAGYNYGASPDTIFPRDGEITGGQGVYRVVETGGTYQGQPVAPITYGPFGLSIYDVPQHQNSVRASMSLRDRQPPAQDRHRFPDRCARPGEHELRRRHPAPDHGVRPQPGDDLRAVRRVPDEPRPERRRLHPGSVDAQPHDAQRRAAVRRAERIVRPVHGGPDEVPAQPEPVVPRREGRELEGNQPACGRLVRSVRRRQDGHQGQHRARRRAGIARDGGRPEPGREPHHHHGPDGERSQPQQRAGLRSAQTRCSTANVVRG